jgi:hypothetical protein
MTCSSEVHNAEALTAMRSSPSSGPSNVVLLIVPGQDAILADMDLFVRKIVHDQIRDENFLHRLGVRVPCEGVLVVRLVLAWLTLRVVVNDGLVGTTWLFAVDATEGILPKNTQVGRLFAVV